MWHLYAPHPNQLSSVGILDNQSRVVQPKIAPNLAPSKHELIYDMIHSGELSITEMAQAAGCNNSTFSRISSNIRMFGSVKAPLIRGGRPHSITPVMLEALCDHLIWKPAYIWKRWWFFWGTNSLFKQRNLASVTSSSPKAGQKRLFGYVWVKAQERNLDLHDEYHYFISDFKS